MPTTAGELIELLAQHPPDTHVGVLVLTAAGEVTDVVAADVIAVDATIGDSGQRRRVWITGVGESSTPAPTLITWRCRCGTTIVLHEHDRWPAEHAAHLTDDDANGT